MIVVAVIMLVNKEVKGKNHVKKIKIIPLG